MDSDGNKTTKHDFVLQLREIFTKYKIERNPHSRMIDFQFNELYLGFMDKDIETKLEIMKNLHDNFSILYEFLALNGFHISGCNFTRSSGFFETKLTFMIDCCIAEIIDGYHVVFDSNVFYNIDDVLNYLKPILDTESINKPVCE